MPEKRPGDWICPDCGTSVFASKESCFVCERASQGKEGDWTCPDCSTVIFAGKESCFKCDRASGGGDWNCPDCDFLVYASKSECPKCSPSKGQGGSKGKPGDWTCPSCHANVFASKNACFQCGEAKPAGGGKGGKSSKGGTAGGKAGGKGGKASSPGDGIKALAKAAPKFKKAWVAYCKQYGDGASDPTKCDEDFVTEFADYVGDLLTTDMGATGEGAVAKAPKRPPAAAEGAPAVKKKLTIKKAVADEIKRLNEAGGLLAPIKLAAVAEKLSEIGEEGALAALNLLEEQQAEVEDPNDFLCSVEVEEEEEEA